MITLDFETHPIEFGKPLLPTPVGVALRWPDGKTEYLAWGHPSGNNCTEEAAKLSLAAIARSTLQILTHNGAGFDIPILEHFTGIKVDPLRVEDTLFLAYLHNPHARSLKLKDLAVDWLGMPTTGQDKLQDWIMANTTCRSIKKTGMHIWEAPADIVGEYAIDDVVMTHNLYLHVKDHVLPVMQEPYDRERRLAPVLADIQRRGVRCDTDRLAADAVKCLKELHDLDWWVKESLNAPSVNIDSNAELVEALKTKGYTGFLTTPTGKPSAGKASLDAALETDPELRDKLKRRGLLATLTGTFMQPWVDIATENGGYIHASYNQVRNPEGYGTRTGRLSSSNPNFQNVPNDVGAGLPLMRSYLLPDAGQVWVCGDFKSQEPRIAAHFEDGALLRAYLDDPELDQYLWVAAMACCTRKEAKVVFLGLLYAMGAVVLANGLGCSPDTATNIRNMVRMALPDIVQLNYDAKNRFARGLPIKTLGGRLYYCEPASNGRTWDYKALNVLVQGSAADQTKEAIIYIAARLQPEERIISTVHDEISVSCSPQRVEAVMEIMRQAANTLPCDAPMLMDIHTGNNWSEAK